MRQRTFADVLTFMPGESDAYARATAAGATGPITVMTFRVPPDEVDAFEHAGRPYFRARWDREVIGLVLGPRTDWHEVAELLTGSFCVMAPQELIPRVIRPADPTD